MSNRRFTFRGLFPVQGTRILISVLLLAAFVIVGCEQTTTKPKVDETCLADKPELRYWLRDRIAVSVQLPLQNGALADKDLATSVASALREQAGPQLDFIAPLIRVGQNATIFYQIAGNNARNKCDSSVLSAVNKINAALSPKISRSELVGANQNLVIPSSELHPLSVSVGGQKVAVAGASPDWLLSSTAVGNDNGGGHPGGPAKIPPASFSPGDASDPTLASARSDGGAGTAVVVLDTGYKLGAAHQAPGACPGVAVGQCAPAAQSVTLNSTVAAALGGLGGTSLGDLGTVLQESDMAVQTDKPYDVTNNGGKGLPITGVPYEFTDANNNPALVVDHGLYISGLIHEAAPKAQIRLVRVLNDYGIGDLQSILIGVQTVAGNPEALAKLLNIDPQRHIVVNMSLGFGPPTDCLIGVYSHWQTLQQAEDAVVQKTGKASQANINCPTDKTASSATPPAEANQSYREPLERLILGQDTSGAAAGLTLPLSLAISNLSSVNKQIGAVVAAAGNESTRDARLDADLPAAICGVLPVGATEVKSMLSLSSTPDPSGLGLAQFSNRPLLDTLPDNFPRLCLAVSGGGEVGAPITVTLKQMDLPSMIAVGVNTCGVYASPVPPTTAGGSATASPSHMAFWDGTSFATGIASGYVARQGIPDGGVFFVPDYQHCN